MNRIIKIIVISFTLITVFSAHSYNRKNEMCKN